MKFRPIPGTLNPRSAWQRLISSEALCSSFMLNPDPKRLANQFGTDAMLCPLPDDGVFYPDDIIPVVRENGKGRRFERARFGFGSSRKLPVGWQIPAKFLTKLPWIDLVDEAKNRCLIPLKGFTQKAKASPGGMAARYGLMGEEAVAWAGLCLDDGKDAFACAGIMIRPNMLVSQYHGQMPLIIRQQDWDNWLQGSSAETSRLLRPFDGPLTVSFVASEHAGIAVGATAAEIRQDVTDCSVVAATAAVATGDLILTADMTAPDINDTEQRKEHAAEDATNAATIANLERLVARAKGVF